MDSGFELVRRPKKGLAYTWDLVVSFHSTRLRKVESSS
jgi:hypothetical protein